MKQGYGVFGKAWEICLRNDPHASESIDHNFMQRMILLDSSSYEYLYHAPVMLQDLKKHELYEYAQQFRCNEPAETIKKVLEFTSRIAKNYDVDFEEMLFGGTERQIIERGTDWCADMARVGAVLLQCLEIPCRIVNIVSLKKAYNGHIIGEAYYENHYGVIDFIYGYQFYNGCPLSAYDIMRNPTILETYPEDYKDTFEAIAINEYDPMDPQNNYRVSKTNDYTRRVIYEDHRNQWMMGEDQ